MKMSRQVQKHSHTLQLFSTEIYEEDTFNHDHLLTYVIIGKCDDCDVLTRDLLFLFWKPPGFVVKDHSGDILYQLFFFNMPYVFHKLTYRKPLKQVMFCRKSKIYCFSPSFKTTFSLISSLQ